MEFRGQKSRGGDSGGTKRRDERNTRGKRRGGADDDRSSHRSSRADTHRGSISESSAKEHSSESRRVPSSAKPFSDDSRLSVLMKRSMRNDDDRDRRLAFIKQLKEYLVITENHSCVLKVSDSIFVTLLEILRERLPRDIKQEVASCLGVVGYLVSENSSRFFDQLFPKILHEHGEETKIMLLVALFETLKQDLSGEELASFMPMIMSKCQTILENADTPELLIAIVDVISHIVRVHPQCFQHHFRDTVDILVGWHIDSTQKDGIVEYTSDALVGFRQFWNADLSFSVTLLGQFLEDMEAYSEDLMMGVSGQGDNDNDVTDPEECVIKIASLLRVFTTVIKSLLAGSNVNNQYLLELFGRLVKCTENLLRDVFREPAIIAANNCLKAMLDKLDSDSLPVKSAVCQFVAEEAVMEQNTTRQHHISFLNLAAKTVAVFGTNITTEFLSGLMGPRSLLPRLCFSQDIQVLDAVLFVYKSIMALKSVPLLDLAYRSVLMLLETAYNILLRDASSDVRCSLALSGSWGDLAPFDNYGVSQSESIAVFCICVLAEIGNAKNNIIGMWALSPSIFSLFSEHLCLLNVTLMERFPTVHFAAVQAFHSHCSRHDNFVVVSQLVTQNSLRDATVLANVSAANAGNLSVILSITADLLFSIHTPDDTRCLVLKWVMELTELVQPTQEIIASCHFTRLIVAAIASGYNPQHKITKLAGRCLLTYLKCASERASLILNSCRDLICMRLTDSDNEVRSVYLELLQLLPLPVAIRLAHSIVDRLPSSISPTPKKSWGEAYQLVVRAHMMQLPSGTFHSHNFSSIMSYILSDQHALDSKNEVLSWLERQFYSCQRWNEKEASGREESFQLSSVIDRNERLLWFWSTWEASQFCVLSRLRTPLGKPQDTFSAIESAIKQCLAALRNQDGENVVIKSASSSSKQAADHYSLCLRTSLLLQFMEHLERHIYNSVEGCAVAMAPSPKAVRTFFWTNRGTCREWLGRVRLSLMSIAHRNRDPAMVVRLGYQLLNDLRDSNATMGSDFEQAIVLVVDALCQLRAPDAVQGMLIWSRQDTNRRTTWMRSSVDIASAKYESAISGFKSCIQNYFIPEGSLADDSREPSPTPSISPRHVPSKKDPSLLTKIALLHKSQESPVQDVNTLNYLVKQVCDCYVKIGSLDEALKWQDTVQTYNNEHSKTPYQKAFKTGYDTSYLSALSSFEKYEFDTVQSHLDSVSSFSISSESSLKLASQGVEFSWSDVSEAVNISERTLVRAVTFLMTSDNVVEASKKAVESLSKLKSTCENALRVSAIPSPLSIDSRLLTLLCRGSQCIDCMDIDSRTTLSCYSTSDYIRFDAPEHDVYTGLRMLHQMELQLLIRERFNESSSSLPDLSNQITELRLATANLARRQCNFRVCERLLIREMPEIVDSEDNASLDADILRLTSKWSQSVRGSDVVSHFRRVRLEREVAKLLFVRGQAREAVESLVSSLSCSTQVKLAASDVKSKLLSTSFSELNARSLITLVKWLQSDSKYSSQLAGQLQSKVDSDDGSVTSVVSGLRLLTSLEATKAQDGQGIAVDLATTEKQINVTDSPSENDLLAGRLLHLSTMQCSSLAKSWFAIANWCYKWGRKAVDCAAHGNVELTTDEKTRVLELLPIGINHSETDAIFTILGSVHEAGNTSNEEDIGDQDQVRYDDGADTVRRQLVSCSPLLQICIEPLVDLWRTVVRRVYHYYQLSAKSYFMYLKLNAEVSAAVDMDGNITATLRLLRLLVKHAWELRDVLEDGLARSPTAPWKGIIPQLFSRLNHPEPYVRQSVSDLLCRVGQDAPHLIVYPAVVGFSSGKDLVKEDASRDGFLNEYLSQAENGETSESLEPDTAVLAGESPSQEDDVLAEDRGTNVLQNCFAVILDSLTINNSKMISEVQLFVNELRRITLLWDELWLGALSQLYQDVTRRLKQLENEVAKVNANTTLTADEAKAIIIKKHQTILKPTIYTMERLQEITQRSAETPHEIAFQQTYGKMISSTLEALRNPANPECPNASWLLFKQLNHSLTQRAQKRTSQLLNMEEISTRLMGLKHTVIAMPGHNSSSTGQVTTIDSIHCSIQILPTKTKPKKLIFIGSDGVRYPYLFKGLEDLHLDERIMQLLSIINNMFVRNNSSQRQLYRARHYSVTPLGARSGLIQWVDGAVPMFSLYKRWHQRDALIKQQQLQLQQQQQQLQQQQQQSAGSGRAVPAPPPAATGTIVVPRPSELFYNKLNPLLRERGISSTDSRKEWPLNVLRKVLDELILETPKDLLAKELWCSSTSAAEWWLVTQTYARSTAVISMIGYIIGLGDRHLDNVLVDLSTGEVVHIDYNVCFEKGKSLRVPEKVPFRMTQNIEAALGLTGVEGTFRLSCEHAMRTMRRGRETLLTLLEAFVYDPLVDWTVGADWGGAGYTGAFCGGGDGCGTGAQHKQSRRAMERDITNDMFCIRVAEAKVAWFENRDQLLSTTQNLGNVVQSLITALTARSLTENQLSKVHKQLEYLNEASKADFSSHPVSTLVSRFQEYNESQMQKDELMNTINNKLNEFEASNNAHEYALTVIRGPKLQHMSNEVSKPVLLTALAGFSPVVEFLQGAGQGQLVSQCEQLCTEQQSAIQNHISLTRTCLDVLHSYATVISHHPRSLEKKNRCYKWHQWLLDLLCEFTSKRVQRIESEMHGLYSVKSIPLAQTQAIIKTERRLQAFLLDSSSRMRNLLDLQSVHRGDPISQLQSAMVLISRFLQDQGVSGVLAVSSVVTVELCSLARRYLDMENALAVDALHLSEPQSPGGIWFLDHLVSLTSVAEILLDVMSDPAVAEVLGCEEIENVKAVVNAANGTYLSLQDLHLNFSVVIVPEALTAFQAQEASVIGVSQDLDQLVVSVGVSLDDAIVQLNTIISKISAANGSALTIDDEELLLHLRNARQSFERLYELHHESSDSELTGGQMLLMGFAGMFSRLDADLGVLLEALAGVSVPIGLNRVGIMHEANLLRMSQNETVFGLLTLLFFIKQLKIMQEFFHQCQQTASALLGSVNGQLYDVELLSAPVKIYIADYLIRHVNGLVSRTLGFIVCRYLMILDHSDFIRTKLDDNVDLSQVGRQFLSLPDMCLYVVDATLSNGAFNTQAYAQSQQLVANLLELLKIADLSKQLDRSIQLQRAICQRSKIELMCYQWLHEDILTASGHQLNSLPRSSLMIDLKKAIQAIVLHERDAIVAVQGRQEQLKRTVIQRLKWAAGANPVLAQTLQLYEEALATEQSSIENCLALANDLVTIGKSVLHFEAMMTRTHEAVDGDGAFLILMNKCETCCLQQESGNSTVTDVEASLMQLQIPLVDRGLTPEWLEAAVSRLKTEAAASKQALDSSMKAVEQARECVKTEVNNIRTVLATHHKLMSDMRVILKAMAKYEEHDFGLFEAPGSIRCYLARYKTFSEQYTAMLKTAYADDNDMATYESIKTLANGFRDLISRIYSDLVSMAPSLTSKNDQRDVVKGVADETTSKKSQLSRVRSDQTSSEGLAVSISTPARCQTPASVATHKEKVVRDPKTGKAMQERNSYAVGVWRRVKLKLDGRDIDSNKRMSIAEQVDFVVKEATSLDNLAVLYEGWTPWV